MQILFETSVSTYTIKTRKMNINVFCDRVNRVKLSRIFLVRFLECGHINEVAELTGFRQCIGVSLGPKKWP